MGDEELVDIRIRLKDARKFMADAKGASTGVDGIGRSTDRTSDKMDRATKRAGLMRRGLGALATTAKYGAVVGFGALAFAVKKSVDNFKESQAISAQTNAVLKSTGGIANVTAKRVDALSASLSMKSGMDDEAITQGQNLLLTFTDIRNEVGKGNKIYDQATKTMTDMSVALGQDTKASAIQLGKALNDPVRGVTALRKVGVSFTQAQQDQIKKLQESGDKLGAQKIILRELNKEFGGSAAAYGKTFGGAVDRAKVVVGNLSEELGAKLAPWLTKAANKVAAFAQQMQTGTGAGGRFRQRLVLTGKVLKQVWDRIVQVGKEVGKFVGWMRGGSKGATVFTTALAALAAGIVAYKVVVGTISLATKAWAAAQTALNVAMSLNPVGLIIAGIIALGVVLVVAYKKVGWFRNAVNAVFNFVRDHWKLILGLFLGPIGLVIVGIVKWRKQIWGAITGAVNFVIDFVRNHWRLILSIMGGPVVAVALLVQKNFGKIVGFVKAMPGKIKSAAHGMWDGIKGAFKSAVNWIIDKWNGIEFGIPAIDPPGPGKFPAVKVSTPNIPRLATGGIVTGRGSWITGERGAELNTMDRRGQVTVRPLPSATETTLADGVGDFSRLGGDEIIEIPVSIDGEVVTRKVVRRVKDRVARSGRGAA